MAGILRAHNLPNYSSKEDNENINPKLTRAGNSRRPALGNVTNQLRRQPQRVAKGKGLTTNADGQENIKIGKVPASFAIFEDVEVQSTRVQEQYHEDEPMLDQENRNSEPNLVLSDAIACLNQIGRPGCHFPLGLSQHAASPMFVDDIRSNDTSIIKHDEFGLDPYFADIYNYLRSKECAHRPSKDYMNRQTDVTTSMRNILVDWLVEVSEEYKLHRETLFLAINYIDRFLSLVGVHRPKLQLVGAASMFIAAKYEEIYPPDVAEFVYITDDSYTKSQVLKMESVILKMLDFRVAVPTINWFCERFINLIDMSEKAQFLSFFITELSLIEVEEFLVFRPSVIAASAIVIARSVLKINDPWPKHMEQITCYTLSELKPCIEKLFSQYTMKETMAQQAVIEKYKQEKFGRVSTIESPRLLAIF